MKKVISIILAALTLLSAVAISFSASAATGISDGGMRHIVCNDAQIATVSQVAFTECGFYIGTSPTSLTKIVEKESQPAHSSIWFPIRSWWKELSPSTTYYWKIYLISAADGKEYQTPLQDFTTKAHDLGVWQTVTDATCANVGKQIQQCNYCHHIINRRDVASPEHNYQTVIITEPTCVTDGKKIDVCENCSASKISAIPANGQHDEGIWTLDFEATLDADGQMSRHCKKCGELLETKAIAKHEHTVGEFVTVRSATCSEDGLQAKICSVCGVCTEINNIPAKGHSETLAEIISTAPTCTAAGEKIRYCTDCGLAIETVSVEALGHDDGVWLTEKDATCLETGVKDCHCTRCGELIGSETVPAKGHSEELVKSAKVLPSCTTAGENNLLCKDCGALLGTETVAALGHDDGVWTVSIAPTCELAGEEICTCTRCGEKIGARKVDALGHDSGVWKVDFEATADHDGQMTRYCSRCGHAFESKSFSKHTHSLGYKATVIAPECEKDGMGGVFCASCGVQYDTYVIEALGHNYSDWHMNNDGTHAKSCSRCHDVQILNCDYDVTTTAPTCTEGGYTTHVCKDCGYNYVDEYVAPLGHDLTEWVDDDELTHSRHCQHPGCDYSEVGEHEWTRWEYDANGKLFHNGTKSRFCPICGLKQTAEAKHSSFFGKILHTIWIWFLNVIFKIGYIIGLNWLFPWINIYPDM